MAAEQFLAQRRAGAGLRCPGPGATGPFGIAGFFQQIGMSGVQRRVPVQGAGRQDRLEHREAGQRAVGHPDRDRAVDLDHRRRVEPGERTVQQRDLRPVGLRDGGRLRVQRGDRGLQLVRAGFAAGQRAVEYARPLGDQGAVPPGPVLLGERHRPSVVVAPRRRPRVVQQHQREQPGRLGVRGQQPVQQPAQPDRLVAQLVADQPGAARGREPLIEDEVDDRAHGAAAVAVSLPGTSKRMPASLILRLARTRRWASVGSGTRNAAAISFVVSPAT